MAAWRSTTPRKAPRRSPRLVRAAKKPSGVQPGSAGLGEVEGDARVPGQPGDHLRVLVSGVVVEDHVHGFGGRNGLLNSVEEADELLMAMALHAATDDAALQHVESGKQRRRAVALVVVGHGPGAPGLHG